MIDPELPTSGYRAWKKQWFDFQKRHGMSDEDAISFLKGDSISDSNYKRLIQVCESLDSIFQVLDTQFGDCTNELRIIRKNIVELPILPDYYDYNKQIDVLKHILRYLIIFHKLFSPTYHLSSSGKVWWLGSQGLNTPPY